MRRIDPDMDIIMQVLDAVLAVRADDAFCKSLKHQYIERGGLSKKQLEGLLGKAQNFTDLPPGKVATLQAIILKKHQKHTSPPATAHLKETAIHTLLPEIDAILAKFPEHKRLLFLRNKDEGKGNLSPAEREEVVRFTKLLANR